MKLIIDCIILEKCLLLLDGASCHFDVEIADTAASLDIVMLCLPSNTTHELQPFDKALFRSMKFAWDAEVDLFWKLNDVRKMDKLDFCKVFSRVWMRAATTSNIRSGFEACGVYPFNPARIPEEAFAPSAPTHIPLNNEDMSASNNQQGKESSSANCATSSSESGEASCPAHL
jgi:hypothetical protein